MADSEDTALGTIAKIGSWLKENKAIAIPVAAGLLGLGAASLGRRREVRQSYEEGFESGWEANERRSMPALPEEDQEES